MYLKFLEEKNNNPYTFPTFFLRTFVHFSLNFPLKKKTGQNTVVSTPCPLGKMPTSRCKEEDESVADTELVGRSEPRAAPAWKPVFFSSLPSCYIQWLFLVPLKGGRWHIILQLAGKMPLIIYHLYIAIPSMGRTVYLPIHEWLIFMGNVAKYTIYGCYGY